MTENSLHISHALTNKKAVFKSGRIEAFAAIHGEKAPYSDRFKQIASAASIDAAGTDENLTFYQNPEQTGSTYSIVGHMRTRKPYAGIIDVRRRSDHIRTTMELKEVVTRST